MEIKTTAKIIESNYDIAQKIYEEESDIENYKGEFEETYNKSWVAVDDMDKQLIFMHNIKDMMLLKMKVHALRLELHTQNKSNEDKDVS